MLQCFNLTERLKNEDFFEIQKYESLVGSWIPGKQLVQVLEELRTSKGDLKESFKILLKIRCVKRYLDFLDMETRT